MQELLETLRAALARATGLAPEEVRIQRPRDPALGDFAFACFPLARVRRKAPAQIAPELAAQLERELGGSLRVEASGPYVNVRVERGELARAVLAPIAEQGERYGASREGRGKTIVLDYSSPNIAKPFHVGHLRSTNLGAALERVFDFLGYETVGINHVGDWGAQFGKLVAAIQRWGGEVDLERDPIRSLLALYVRYHEEEPRDPELAEQARAAFRELESGREGEVRRTWTRLTRLSLGEFERIYRRLGVRFDHVRGEAFYEPLLEQTIQRVVEAGVAEESQGALVVHLEEDVPPCLLRKSDGTTLYATRDLAALFQRWEEFHFHRCLYVVGSDQRLHFRQLVGVLRRMGFDWAERVEHVDFGMMSLPQGKLSTRRGQVVFLEQLLDRAVEEARRIIAEKNPELAQADRVAEEVGIGAVVFHDLRRERVKDVVFEWREVLSFEGETGPYVQYTHARLGSILRKAAADADRPPAEPDFTRLADAAEILLALGRFGEVVQRAAAKAEPSEISRYLLELCRSINGWYVQHRVLVDEAPLRAARLALVSSAKTVIGNGLRLLGVAAPEEM